MSHSGYALLKIAEDAPKNVKTRIYKVMNGTTVSMGNRRYRSRGLIKSVNGIQLSGSLYLVPLDRVAAVLEALSRKELAGFVHVMSLCTCTCGEGSSGTA